MQPPSPSSTRKPLHHLLASALYITILLLAFTQTAHAQETIAPQRQTVSGPSQQLGAEIGKAYAQVIRRLTPQFVQECMFEAHLSRADLDHRAADLAGHMSADDLAEIQGLAQGAGISYQNALILNLFYSINQQGPACRQLAVWGKRTADGNPLHARNLDWVDYPGNPLNDHNLILDCQPDSGYEYVTFTWPGLVGVLTATNRQGLTVGFNTLPPSPAPPGSPGTPGPPGAPRSSEPTFFTLARVMRSCATINQAVSLIRQAAPLDNASIMISSLRDKRAVVVEIVAGQVGVRQGELDVIGNANYPTLEAGVPGAESAGGLGPADTPACILARNLLGPFDLRRLTTIMSDRQILSPKNLLSVVFDPAHNQMLVACGHVPAGAGPYEPMPIFSQER